MSITNGIASSKIYDKRDDFNFEIINFLFLDGYVPRSTSYGVYILILVVRTKRLSGVVWGLDMDLVSCGGLRAWFGPDHGLWLWFPSSSITRRLVRPQTLWRL